MYRLRLRSCVIRSVRVVATTNPLFTINSGCSVVVDTSVPWVISQNAGMVNNGTMTVNSGAWTINNNYVPVTAPLVNNGTRT